MKKVTVSKLNTMGNEFDGLYVDATGRSGGLAFLCSEKGL